MFQNKSRLWTIFSSVCSPKSLLSLTSPPSIDKATKTRLSNKFFLSWNVQHRNDLIIGRIDEVKSFLVWFSHLFSNHESNLIFKWVHVLPGRPHRGWQSRDELFVFDPRGVWKIIKGALFLRVLGAMQCVVIVLCVCVFLKVFHVTVNLIYIELFSSFQLQKHHPISRPQRTLFCDAISCDLQLKNLLN